MLNLEEKTAALQRTKLFRYAEPADLAYLAENLQEEQVDENVIIFKQGEENDTAFLILEGKVDIFIDDILMAHYSADQIFGELSMLDGTPYTATAKAVTPVRILKIPSEVLFQAFHQTENLSISIIKSMCKRLKRQILV